METLTSPVQRTFSHDKYDAMEANIHYININEKENTGAHSKKRKNDKKIYYVIVTILLTIIAVCLIQGAIKNNDYQDNSPARSLYENFNLSEMVEDHQDNNIYEHHIPFGDDFTMNHYFDKANLYYNETEFINYENHDVDKYKKGYYKLLKVCIPQLRKGK